MTKSIASLALVAALAAGCCRGTRAAPDRTSHAAIDGGTEIADLARVVRPTVVNITAVEGIEIPEYVGAKEIAAPRRVRTYRREMEGAGFILDASGHVVTNAHLVAEAKIVHVQLADERELTAHVVASDPYLDVAVLSVEGASNLPAAALGSSQALEIGDSVVAVGNPFGFKHSVTSGIVSAKGRVVEGPLDDLIQIDAPINPGNSGGPLFNRRGEVIGINTVVSAHGCGVAFAVPIDAVREVLPQLLAKGHVDRGQLGIFLQEIDAPLAKALRLPEPVGALVASVEPKGPAERAGLERGDVVVSVDGVRMRDPRMLDVALARRSPGSVVVLGVSRSGKSLDLKATLSALDTDDAGAAPPLPTLAGWGVDLVEEQGEVHVRDVAIASTLDGRLERGDRIVEIDRTPVKTRRDLEDRWTMTSPHLLLVEHDGIMHFVGLAR